MKTRFFVFVLIGALFISAIITPSNSHPIPLSKPEMEKIAGGEDPPYEPFACTLVTIGGYLVWFMSFFSGPPGYIIAYLYGTEVIDNICTSVGSTGAPCDPCPNGGYEEEYSTCQQNGAQILGQSQCSTSPNRICCMDY